MTTNTTAAASFTPDTMTVNGQTFPVEYSVTPDQTVFVFLTATVNDQTKPLRIRIGAEDPRHAAALAAARPGSIKAEAAQPEPIQAAPAQAKTEAPTQAETEAPTQAETEAPAQAEAAQAEAPAPIQPAPAQAEAPARCLGFEELPHRPRKTNAALAQTEPAPVEVEPAPAQAEAPAPIQPEPAQAEAPAPAARDPKQARGPVPQKDFIGQVIKGQGWKIVFDGSEERTRVIFLAPPPQAAEKATQEAGFFWSPLMKSWNKKLSFKAYRAAQGLALQLRAICG